MGSPLLTAGTVAQTKSTENTMKLDKKSALPEAFITDVSWLSGHWYGEAFGGVCEEIWSPPSGKSMMCMYKMMKEDKVIFYKFLIIVEEAKSLNLKLKHFNPDMTSWEEKDKYVEFPLVKIKPNEVYFDGLTFKKIDENTLYVFLRMKQKDGTEKEEKFVYYRMNKKK